MSRVAVIGSRGQLGSDIVKNLAAKNWQVFPLEHKDIEIKDKTSVSHVLSKIGPDIVVNTAAFHDLVECERNPGEAFAVNALGVINLAKWTGVHHKTLVHFSTDYVFNGENRRKKPFRETDPPNPKSIYSISKLTGEMMLTQFNKQHFVIRTSGLFGAVGSSVKKTNFVEQRITQAKRGKTIKMVKDQVLSPTYTKNVAENVDLLIRTRRFGAYHMVSQGQCSWYEFTNEILKLTDLKTKLVPVETDDSAAGVARPRYSALTNYALGQVGIDRMRHWKTNLRFYLQEKGHIA